MLELDVSVRDTRPTTKDPILVLRDRYWALSLRGLAGGKSFAELERDLCPHLHVRDREDGEGKVQPFSLSKVALGTRGLSPSVHGWPEKVAAAEAQYAGSSRAFTSLLWQVLACVRSEEGIDHPARYVSDAVTARFGTQHHTRWIGSNVLNEAGVRRAGRITHIDALGLLLWVSSPLSRAQRFGPLAATYVMASVERLNRKDPAFATLRDEIVRLISARLPDAMPVELPFSRRTFQSHRGRLAIVPLVDLV